jgi:hypothetical protein
MQLTCLFFRRCCCWRVFLVVLGSAGFFCSGLRSVLLCSGLFALFCPLCYIRQSDGLGDTLFKGAVSRVLCSGSYCIHYCGNRPSSGFHFRRNVCYICVVAWTCLIVAQITMQKPWLPSRCLTMDARSDSDILAFRRHATIYTVGLVITDIYVFLKAVFISGTIWPPRLNATWLT